jgi:hypothetical protein
MGTSQWVKVAVSDRKDTKLTVSRTGDLYGCQLTLFVKLQGEGAPELVPDARGQSSTDFILSPDVRTIPKEKLTRAESVFVDVIVVVSQPARLSGTIDFSANLEMAGQPPWPTSNTVVLKPGDDADVTHLGWEIESP